jgi:arylsulfatase A-like enzyme/tetratricopeptide (TPR) repeat protein
LSRRHRHPAARLFLLALLVFATACARRPSVFPGAPVVVISVDTLRADHLPAYGAAGVETPNLEALRKESILFDNAIAHAPLTLPSHVSIFTGLLPFQHGVRDNLGYRLTPAHQTLASQLKGRGYATGAAVSAIVLERSTGIAEGFDFYDDAIEIREAGEPMGRVQRSGFRTEKMLEDWIAGTPPGKPLLAFLHLYEPHSPYEPPEPFRSRYASNPYDGEIAAADAIVGRFLDFLKARGIYDRACILFLSDHGEGLGEHGEDEHGILLYRATIHVPFFLKLPGSVDKGHRRAEPVQLIDVVPTVLSLLGEKPIPGLPGTALWPDRGPEGPPRAVYSESLYPRLHFGWSDLASLTDARYQYIEAPRPELYDWTADPKELQNLAPGLPPPFRALRIVLGRLNRPFQAPGASDAETVKKLASLGYIGAAAPTAERAGLPDPKDRIATLDTLKNATRLISRHRDEEALMLLRRAAQENPLMLDAWEALARTLRRLGRPAEALEALSRVDRLSPATPQILLALADVALEARDYRRARSYAEAASAAGAGNVHGELAAIALAEGHVETARSEALASMALRKTSRAPLLLLARVEQQKGNFAGAMKYLDEALEIEKGLGERSLVNLQSTRGDVLARMGREKEAEQAFRAEVTEFPENFDAWSRLAFLYASQSRVEDLRRLLSDMTEKVPTIRSYETAAFISETVGDRAAARVWRARKADHFRSSG